MDENRQSQEAPAMNVNDNERMVSVVLGSVVALWALRRSLRFLFMAAVGGYLVYRGYTGSCAVYRRFNYDSRDRPEKEPEQDRLTLLDQPAEKGIQVERSVTVNRPLAEVYEYWRDLENLSTFMHHVDSIRELDDKRSHWIARTPVGGVKVEWDAEITEDVPNEKIAWSSLAGSTVNSAGTVKFRPAPGDQGTEVHVTMAYRPPLGAAGAAFARIFNKVTAQQIKEDMRRFKEVMETGETATAAGQPSGRGADDGTSGLHPSTPPPAVNDRRHRYDVVEKASSDSFPASDPPSYASGRKEDADDDRPA